MKLATLKQGRDGELIIVSRDLSRAVSAVDIAPTLQAAIEEWATVSPKLEERYAQLNSGSAEGAFALDQSTLHSPLPRAYQWADGSAYLNHVKLVRQARNAEMPDTFWTDPLMYQGGSDGFLAPTEDIEAVSEEHGIDFEGEIAVITDDVPMAVTPEQAAKHIKLVMLVNDVSLRGLIPGELAKGFGFFQAKPASSFSPIAVTPDELGDAWQDGKVHLPLTVHLNGEKFGEPEAGPDMIFSFPQLVAHAAKTRYLGAGAVIGSGTVSNPDPDGGPGKPVADGGVGYSCLAEVRMVEQILYGQVKTPFMRFGDQVRIEMFDRDGNNIFGTIDQQVVKYQPK
ncbi:MULTISPECIES: fumarylacetoacetate hydrolase family protein [unclassified Halomonas]|uniref:fumarylacetoacetate hydrolase family protein n=1 Tax=unclassified Halomonas TaxID=2609666 RepID=UPI0007DA4617|nr:MULTISPECIES: fumarylacetoacetate hydrolase family protein [unclassified Halomonas]MBT2786459.1 fumarylacetoacetate hydrolase family protein [Halomonas sp. ISL-106]MBT2797481.1 fumarylacetoacetate hydrolase family protein [Halomonas sp. ISL-104]OAL58842.1 2-keto-4-pentenoate hydratase [Halomonas sp. ALS9]